jgi:hypothetical protein
MKERRRQSNIQFQPHLPDLIQLEIVFHCENCILNKSNNGPQATNWVSVLIQTNSRTFGRVKLCLLFIILFSSHFNSPLTCIAPWVDLFQFGDFIGCNSIIKPMNQPWPIM